MKKFIIAGSILGAALVGAGLIAYKLGRFDGIFSKVSTSKRKHYCECGCDCCKAENEGEALSR